MSVIDFESRTRQRSDRGPVGTANLTEHRAAAYEGRVEPPELARLARSTHPQLWYGTVLVAALALLGPRVSPVYLILSPLLLLLGPVFVLGALVDSLHAGDGYSSGFLGRWSPVALRAMLLTPIFALVLCLLIFPVLAGADSALRAVGYPASTAGAAVLGLFPFLGLLGLVCWLRALHSLCVTGNSVVRAGQDGFARFLRSQGGSWVPLGSGSGLPQTLVFLLLTYYADLWLCPAVRGAAGAKPALAALLATRFLEAMGLSHLLFLLAFAWMVELDEGERQRARRSGSGDSVPLRLIN